MDALRNMVLEKENIARLIAGTISPEDFFTREHYNGDKEIFLSLYKMACPNLQDQESFFSQENIATA